MYVKPQMKKLEMYVPGKSTGGIKLSSNENPFGASPKIREVLAQFNTFERYPDGGTTLLKEKLAAFLNVEKNQLIFGAGGDEVIQMISRSVLSPGDNIIQAFPTFPQYEHHAIIEDADIQNIPLKNGVHDLDGMLAAVNPKTKMIWVCNPNNPTGTYVNEVDLKNFLDAVPTQVLVVVDEAYVEYVTAKDFPNTIPLLAQYPNLVILRTFSKVYGLASFRIGYGIGNVDFIQDLEVGRLPFNTSAIAQEAAAVALDDQAFVEASMTANTAGLLQYVDFLEEAGVPYYPSQANFIFIPSPRKLGLEIGAKLMDAGYIVRSFPRGIRITIGTKADNEGIIACLKEHLDMLG
ncbi:MAG: histidinol-phosphate transaminase [Defluviitaleaceae bacterium]|nr:histidinol-phosphate transaminase [Defluviitaleaceae bacterium]